MPLSGPIRARDLRANIKELGFEQGVVMTVELLLEEHSQDRQHLREMTDLLNQCIDIVNELSLVGEGMQKRLDQIKRDQTGEAET